MAQQTAVMGGAAGAAGAARAPVAAAPNVSLGDRFTKPRSLWGDAWRRLVKNRAALIGGCTIIAFWLTAILAPFIAPYGMNEQNHTYTFRPPAWTSGNWNFILGTDGVGRDELSRLIWGARISMVVGIIPVTIHLIIGGLVGMLAGYSGGRADNLLMRIVDIFYAFPGLLLVIIMSVAFRDTWLGQQMGGLLLIFVALAIVGWEGTARVVRGQVLSSKRREYVEAARAIGAGSSRIMWRHIVPNISAPIIVGIAFAIPAAIFAEAGLSFIGLGVRPPTASWGNMIQDGLASLYSNPVLIAAPAICVGIVMLSFTFLGDGLRDALDPRMKQ
jgi:oligopeptide transport system permease protein